MCIIQKKCPPPRPGFGTPRTWLPGFRGGRRGRCPRCPASPQAKSALPARGPWLVPGVTEEAALLPGSRRKGGLLGPRWFRSQEGGGGGALITPAGPCPFPKQFGRALQGLERSPLSFPAITLLGICPEELILKDREGRPTAPPLGCLLTSIIGDRRVRQVCGDCAGESESFYNKELGEFVTNMETTISC